MRRSSTPHTWTRARTALAVALVASVLTPIALLVSPPGASAAPAITLVKSGDESVLVGGTIDYTLTASNPTGTDAAEEYNLSLRDQLPAGVTYVGGSTTPAVLGEPQVYTDATSGRQTLVWLNVSDLPPGATTALSFRARAAAATYPVGSTVPNAGATAHADTDPRVVPDFDAAGAYVSGSAAQQATAATFSTAVTALTLTKSEPSPEGELLRGVHRHTTVYSLLVTNNDSFPTTNVTLVDTLPAGLEFLGCGTVDNSAAPEYPGAPSLTATPDVAPADCPTPASVATLTDPTGYPAGVYTRVTWQLGTLAAGASTTVRYRAGIPLRANVAFGSGGPTPASGLQTANLDNNTGAPTRETDPEGSLVNRARVEGDYSGVDANGQNGTRVSDVDSVSVEVEDLSLQKSVSPTQFTQGGIATYTLRVRGSEYTSAGGVVVTDELPDGLCPLSATTNYSQPTSAPCAPVAGRDPSVPFGSVTANPDGTFTIVFAPVAVAPDEVLTITYHARMRPAYLGRSGSPTSAGDAFTNRVRLVGTTTPDATTNPIDAGNRTVRDVSQATIGSGAPSIVKSIKPDVTPYGDCTTGGYTATPAASAAAFAEGSRVCFRVRVDFPSGQNTRLPIITDFLPPNVSYEAGSAQPTAANTVAGAATPVATAPLRWEPGAGAGTSRTVGPGEVFEVVLAGIVTAPGAGPQPDLTGNLAKLRWQSSDGAVFALRDDVDLRVAAPPPVSVLKSAVRKANGATVLENGLVTDDELLTYTVAVTNGGSSATANDDPVTALDVRDLLPAGITCSRISTISDGGACFDPATAGYPAYSTTNTSVPAGRSVVRWDVDLATPLAPGGTRGLTYDLRVPATASVSQTYTNYASVASYESATNIGTATTHYPARNIDPAVTVAQVDAPATSDTHTVRLADVVVGKSVLSTNQPGTTGVNVVNGEQVVYRLTVSVPAGTTVFNGVLTDRLPAGFTALSATVAYPGGVDPSGFTFNTTTGALTFPSTYTNTTSSAQLFTVDLTALLGNSTIANLTTRTNTAAFNSRLTLGGTAIPERTRTANVAVVVPAPVIDKGRTPSGPVAAGTVLTYSLAARNDNPAAPLRDVYVVDCVPAGLTVTGIVTPVPTGTTAGYTAGTGTGAGGNGCAVGTTRVLWEGDPAGTTWDLLSGSPRTLRYTAQVDPQAAGAQTYTNTATLTGSTIPDGSAPLTGAVAPGERVLTATDSEPVSVTGSTLTKTALTPTVPVGGRARYRIETTIPADVNFYDAAVTDLLPTGLDVASLQTESVTCAPGCTVPGTALTPSGRTVGWSLGDLTATSGARTVTIVYSATVSAAETANQRGVTYSNSARVRWNLVDGATPTTADGPWTQGSSPVAAVVTATEPLLAVDKSVDLTDPRPGDTFVYTVQVTNRNDVTNTSDAHGVVVVDTVPAGVRVVPGSLPTSAVLSGTDPVTGGGGTITWTVPGSLARGAVVTLTYSARLTSPARTTVQTNTADITRYTSLPAADGGGRVYDGPTDTAAVRAALPHVSVAKAFVGTGLAYIGEASTFQITATSDGTGPIRGVDLRDVLPPNWVYQTGSAQVSVAGGEPARLDPATSTSGGVQTLTWTDLGTLATGQQVVVTYRATPTAGVVGSPGVGSPVRHTNTVSVTGEDADGQQGPDGGGSYAGPPASASVLIHAADVSIDKRHTGTPVAGRPFKWTLTVANAGIDAAVGPFTVTDTLPSVLTGVTASGPGWSCSVNPATNALTCTRTSAGDILGVTEFLPITVTATVPTGTPDGTDLTNSAAVTVRTYDLDPSDNSDTDPATVDALADLGLVKTLSGELVAGRPTTYLLTVTNHGPSLHRGLITVTDELPAGLTYLDATGDGWDCDESPAGTVTCTRSDDRAVGAMPVITVRADVDPDATGSITNRATVQGTVDDPGPNVNSEGETTPVATLAEVTVKKSHSGSFVAGTRGTYTFTVVNAGPSVARAPVRVTDPLPDGLAYVSFASVDRTWSCSATAAELVTCDLTGDLAVGEDAVVEIVVDVAAGQTDGFRNTATVTSPTDPTADDDTDDTDVDVETDLAVEKSHTGEATAGEPFTWRIEVRNDGPSDLPGPVVVTDTLPAGVSAASASGAGWSCEPPSARTIVCTRAAGLGTGVSAPAISVDVEVDADAGPSTLTNVAEVDAPITDTDPLNDVSSDPTVVVDSADITVEKSLVDAGPFRAGDPVPFDVVVTNRGPSDADTVTVTDLAPAGTTLTALSGPGWTCVLATATCTRPTVAAAGDGRAPAVRAVVTIDPGTPAGTLTNRVEVSTTTPGDDPDDNDDTVDFEVVTAADLGLTKTFSGTAPTRAGETTTFDLLVNNDGPSDAAGPIEIVDTLPDGLTFVAADDPWSCTPGAGAAAQTVTCRLPGPLVAGADAPLLTLTVLVDPAVDDATTLTNVATVGSGTTDPEPGNDTDDADVVIGVLADLSVVKTATGPATVGEDLTWTIAVRNGGPSDARDVVVTDTLPAGLSVVTATGTGWTCEVVDDVLTCELDAPLPPRTDAAPITVVTLVGPAAYPQVANTAVVTGSTPEAPTTLGDNTSGDVVDVPAQVDLAIEKELASGAGADLGVGRRAVYRLSVTNAGPTEDPGPITVRDTLPAGLAFVAATGTAWTCAATGPDVTCTRDDALGVGETTRIRLVVDVLPAAYPEVLNVATVGSDAVDTDPSDNADDLASTVTPDVDLVVAKTADLAEVAPGDVVRWSIVVTNRGANDTVDPVVVTDPLPEGLAFERAFGPGFRCAEAARVVTCTATAPIAAGASTSLTVVTRVRRDTGEGDDIRNVATVSNGTVVEDEGEDDVVVSPSGSEPDDDGTGQPMPGPDAPVDGPDATPGGDLPGTGGPPLLVLLLGLGLTLAGGVLLLGRRGRSGAQPLHRG